MYTAASATPGAHESSRPCQHTGPTPVAALSCRRNRGALHSPAAAACACAAPSADRAAAAVAAFAAGLLTGAASTAHTSAVAAAAAVRGAVNLQTLLLSCDPSWYSGRVPRFITCRHP